MKKAHDLSQSTLTVWLNSFLLGTLEGEKDEPLQIHRCKWAVVPRKSQVFREGANGTLNALQSSEYHSTFFPFCLHIITTSVNATIWCWHAAIHGVSKSQTRLSYWTELNWTEAVIDFWCGDRPPFGLLIKPDDLFPKVPL